MKRFSFLALTLAATATFGVVTPSKVLLAQAQPAQPDKIAQVKAGTLKEARASWWGFDESDATTALQNAINSGVPKLIVDNMGSDWMISKSIKLISNQEIVFEDGVVIQAMKDKFHGRSESLIVASQVKNIKLIGEGKVILRMHRDDYDNKKLYSKSEHRHGISLRDAENIVLRGLTVAETGGDGLYIGAGWTSYSKNILVENCAFDKNYRQGISVISVEDLIIRDCKFSRTKGTNPQYGIDFEPNRPGQRLVNCLVENSEFTDNHGGAIEIYPNRLNKESVPISITIRNCVTSENGNALTSAINETAVNSEKGAPTGKVIVEKSTFNRDRINLRNPIKGSVEYLFKDSQIDFTPTKDDEKTPAWKNIPINLQLDQSVEYPLGGITFDNVTVTTDKESPIDLNVKGQGEVSQDISGTLFLKKDGKTAPFDLAGLIQQKHDELTKRNALQPAIFDSEKVKAPAKGEKRQGNDGIYTERAFTFLQYAEKGQKITLNVTARKVYPDRDAKVQLQKPDGAEIETYSLPNKEKFPITFTAEQTGLYRLVRVGSGSQRIDIDSVHPGNGFLIDENAGFLPKNGTFYFEVPAGVKEFTIGAETGSSADVALVNPEGNEVDSHKNVNSLQLLSATRPDAANPEIWAIKVSNVVWIVRLYLYGDLTPIVSSNPATLLRKK